MDYRNVREFLKANKCHSAGSVYNNFVIKDKIYYRLPSQNKEISYNSGHKYENTCIVYEKLTILGKTLGLSIILIVSIVIFIIGILTGQFKETFNLKTYKESEIIRSVSEDMFVGSPYSKEYGACFSSGIPKCVPENMYIKFLKKKYRIRKWYTHKTTNEKKLLKYREGTNLIALKRLEISDDYWESLESKLISNLKNNAG